MSLTLEKDIYEKWKTTCGELNKVDRELLNLKMTDYLFRRKHIKKLTNQFNDLHRKWEIYFDLLSEHNIFDTKESNVVRPTPYKPKEWL